jgi:hypothetical protein
VSEVPGDHGGTMRTKNKEPQTVTLKCFPGPRVVPAVYVNGGLAVHHDLSWGGASRAYVITHIKIGMMVPYVSGCKTQKAAKANVEALLKLADWTKGVRTILRTPGLKEAVRAMGPKR